MSEAADLLKKITWVGGEVASFADHDLSMSELEKVLMAIPRVIAHLQQNGHAKMSEQGVEWSISVLKSRQRSLRAKLQDMRGQSHVSG
jgi:hypothetical protein